MESIQNIKKRIASIQSTKQITQSMRMVSSSKVVKARNKMENNREFIASTSKIVQTALLNQDAVNHRYVKPAPVGVSAVILIASDRGLCGGYNINVCRYAHEILRDNENKIVTIGAKARDYLNRRSIPGIENSFNGISENPFFEDALDIANIVVGWYDAGQVDSIKLVFTHFASMLTQEPCEKQLLPLVPQETGVVTLEPQVDEYLEKSLLFYVTSEIFGAILESSLSEQCARITSMDTAVKNSGDMIDTLTLKYNQARQGRITQELTEIIGGTQAKRR